MPKVCLDPGHGPGCVNGSPDGSYKEQEFAYDVACRVKALLTARGVSVVLTRDAQGYPSLAQRCQISNGAKADAFVSLHSNAVGSGGWNSASGLEMYTSAGPDSAPRNVLAARLKERFQAQRVALRTIPIRHVGYDVLVGTDAPAVLIEYGFHTSQSDVELLKDSTYREKLAKATADGVCAFLGVTWTEQSTAGESDRAIVQRRFQFADETMDYLAAYPYAGALLERLATAD
ncbi:MAG TPA: N-acetylmuramoyl-L-alanine amidase [Candidatus Flavonifractor merdigallinarum]|uniref:N-acetylmuramoyl-L-alanine amidase n=1 Tax=Candidatus Flavonifractor merdigallinarum TaxID=2838589 RepID=A0A9D2BXJ6_9FIRM|nr:N-acetylmuramoyl-L-alanine amidase [Candidatus Flavonifractor merdigallinarum]